MLLHEKCVFDCVNRTWQTQKSFQDSKSIFPERVGCYLMHKSLQLMQTHRNIESLSQSSRDKSFLQSCNKYSNWASAGLQHNLEMKIEHLSFLFEKLHKKLVDYKNWLIFSTTNFDCKPDHWKFKKSVLLVNPTF